MALIKCPECNKQISDKAESCPKCGYELHQSKNKKNTMLNIKNFPKKYLLIGIIIIGGILWYSYSNNAPIDTTPSKDNYTTYKSDYLEVSFSYPKGYNVITGDDNLIYISENLKDNTAVIPYILIGRYDNYSSPILFINDFTTYMNKQYSNTFKLSSQVMTGVVGDKSVYGIEYSYQVNNKNIVDCRYAVLINNKVYMIGSKEIDQNTETINNVVTEVISSLTEGGI